MRFRMQCKSFQGGGSFDMVGVQTEQTCSPLLFVQVLWGRRGAVDQQTSETCRRSVTDGGTNPPIWKQKVKFDS